jgi:hypothetical protein
VSKPDQPFAKIVSAVKSGNGVRARLDAIENVFAIIEQTFADPARKARHRFFVAVQIVEDEKDGVIGRRSY